MMTSSPIELTRCRSRHRNIVLNMSWTDDFVNNGAKLHVGNLKYLQDQIPNRQSLIDSPIAFVPDL
jgi:hypothetical protein